MSNHCHHGQLARQCLLCEQASEIEQTWATLEGVTLHRNAPLKAESVCQCKAEIERLRSFALAVVCYDDHYFEDCDGGYLQATAVKYGIAYKVTMEAPCGEYCACADTILYDEWPLECYRIAPEILAAKGE